MLRMTQFSNTSSVVVLKLFSRSGNHTILRSYGHPFTFCFITTITYVCSTQFFHTIQRRRNPVALSCRKRSISKSEQRNDRPNRGPSQKRRWAGGAAANQHPSPSFFDQSGPRTLLPSTGGPSGPWGGRGGGGGEQPRREETLLDDRDGERTDERGEREGERGGKRWWTTTTMMMPMMDDGDVMMMMTTTTMMTR